MRPDYWIVVGSETLAQEIWFESTLTVLPLHLYFRLVWVSIVSEQSLLKPTEQVSKKDFLLY